MAVARKDLGVEADLQRRWEKAEEALENPAVRLTPAPAGRVVENLVAVVGVGAILKGKAAITVVATHLQMIAKFKLLRKDLKVAEQGHLQAEMIEHRTVPGNKTGDGVRADA